MKRIFPSALALCTLLLGIVLFASPVLAQDSGTPSTTAEIPTAIVVQSVGSSSGAIEWVILIQIVAFLVLLTLLMNGTIQDKLRTPWRKKEMDSAESKQANR